MYVSKDRRGILKRKSRCVNCFKTGHNMKNCFNTKWGRHCIMDIITSQFQRYIYTKVGMPLEVQSNPTRNDISKETQTESTTVTTTRSVLLQTASCMAVNDNNSIPVHVLLNDGSLVSRLNWKPVKSEIPQIDMQITGNRNAMLKGCV